MVDRYQNGRSIISIIGINSFDMDYSYLLWNYLGKKEYTKLYSLCEEYERQNVKMKKLQSISAMQLKSILEELPPIVEVMTAKMIPMMYEDYLKKHNIDDTTIDEHIKNSITNAQKNTIAWSDFLNDELWITSPFSPKHPAELLTLLVISSLIEIANGTSSDIGIDTLSSFVDHRASLRIVLDTLPESLISYLIELIQKKSIKNSENKRLKDFFKRIEDLQQEIMNEDIYY